MEHLYELRRRLTIAALALAVGGVVGFLWFNHDPFGLPSLGRILTAPYCDLPSDRRATLNGDAQSCTLLATGVFDAFFLQFKVGLVAGVVLSSPVWLGQFWGFITPGLYAKEKKYARVFVGCAAFLFTCGAVLAYFIVAQGLKVLLGFSSGVVSVALSPNDYFGFVVALLIIFGVSFELPLLVVMLNRVGVLPAANLKKWRRGIIMGLFVFAAFATPGSDVISMLALALALVVLFELAVLIASAHDRRKERTSADAQTFSDLDDDEPSPLDLSGGTSESGYDHDESRYTDTNEDLRSHQDPRSYTDAT
ncbi:MAG: twin-arginine translocase subunit TatC [Mycobacteriaceae bacterium]